MNLLTVAGLEASYGASKALFDVNLTVDQGEVVALMGRNGMGKSTTIKSICRMLTNTQGEIRFLDRSLHSMASYEAVRLGIGLVPEGRRCFPNLTVQENLIVGSQTGHWDIEKVGELFPRLIERAHQSCKTLSGGEQQMVAIGRALMTNPKLLILDEATEGLAPIVRQEIWSAIKALKATSDMAILLIDKSIKELSSVADRAVILERGMSVWEGRLNTLDDETLNERLGV
ncbi:ABC transporter ATP-binding protein [Grimontia sp. NTOU-MAR1]|uniref:ABC transporter ATP-binding protein n=1 Tax=Grimontia sp. NTOU-MAR1 TaxID=3111011 RepID=UPI002DBE9C21|nr:ABC transporter ATP-binding protein [Grimontia sp. NTOU-MAR1]WRV99706.1 ABC transporter ATP-binding protein [Grimontia sp. NTOU-MAR1]